MHERLSNRIGLVKELGIGVAAITTVIWTVDAYNNSGLWKPPVNDPLYQAESQKEHQLRQGIEEVKREIYTSRDARENAVRREQINILERDLDLSINTRNERTGYDLVISRFFGSIIGPPMSVAVGLAYLGKAFDFIRRRKTNVNIALQVE